MRRTDRVLKVDDQAALAVLDRDARRGRDRIERFLSKRKHCRAIATGFEKHDDNFLALVKRTATRIWFRVHEPVTRACAARLATGPHRP
ncbi:MAG: hypothetical protein CMI50_12140 [Paracoccus sp.]|nr:hypothetical protein [Paracoccus sp. (in: a-proteobacteria)]MBA48957.1 hypothetical protein [Paracoccus sp. (in: a-proteobacteria)]HIC65367.1 hypothetical protein [Paracoccus sp. (in: a-proteobacteria)]